MDSLIGDHGGTMLIQEFAERVLLGKSLSEKLLQADDFEDHPSGYQKSFPRLPHRPPGLSLDRWHRSKRITFPNIKNLDHEKQRGIVLHFFANHELLALELIALALLKFAEAPAKFRWGLLNTLLEEQTHLKLYEARMRHYQVELGEIPVNDFFWKCLSSMETPLEFVSGMSLTLEQANLDYAQYYATIFRQIGDTPTAEILDQVYHDEIGHVHHGLKWLHHWKRDNQSDWEAYQSTLTFPLTPARAKGLDFNKAGRRLAGFSEDFITELSLFSQSKGRVPNVFYFNPACEAEIVYDKPGWTPTKGVAQLTADLTTIPMFFSRQDDLILVEKKPRIPFLTSLQQAGFGLPEFVEIQPASPTHPLPTPLFERKIGQLQPWGRSPASAYLLAPLKKEAPALWDQQLKPFFSKIWSVEQLNDFLAIQEVDSHWQWDRRIVGHPCFSSGEVEHASAHFRNQGFEHLVVKAAFGASGQNMVHLFTSDAFAQKKNRIEKLLRRQGAVVIEPWLEKVLDFSFHFDVQREQKFSMVGLTQFFTDSRGQYQGSVVGRFDSGLDAQLLTFLHYQPRQGQSHSLASVLETIASRITPTLYQAGYTGPVSIDALVYQTPQEQDGGLRLKPIVEINPRFSMGRLSLELASHLQHRHLGVWLIVTLKEVQASGFETFSTFSHTLETHYPLETTSASKPKIRQGVLFTNDPDQAQGFLSLLIVGQSLQECLTPLAQILKLPQSLRKACPSL